MTLDDRLETELEEPVLAVDPVAWDALVGWSRATDLEVSGLGRLVPTDDGFRMTDAYLVRQSATAYETELDPADLAALVARLADDGTDTDGLRVWWHSHAREAPFWSGVDERTIASFAPIAMISIVIDHRLRRLARLDRFAPRGTAWVELDVAAGPVAGDESSPDAAAADAYRGDVERLVIAADGRPGSSG